MQIFLAFIPFLLFGKCLCSNEPNGIATVQANASTTNGTVPSFVVPTEQESPIKSSFAVDNLFVTLVLEPSQKDSTYTAEDVLAALDNETLTEKITSVLDNEALTKKSISQVTVRNMNLGEFTGTVLNGIIENMRNLELISPKNTPESLNSFKEALMNNFKRICDDEIEKIVEELKLYFKSFKEFIVFYADEIFSVKSRDWHEFLENWEYCIDFSDATLSCYSDAIKNVIRKYISNPISLEFNSLTEYFESNLDEEFKNLSYIPNISPLSTEKIESKVKSCEVEFEHFKRSIVPFADDIMKLKLNDVNAFCQSKWSEYKANDNSYLDFSRHIQKYVKLVQDIINNRYYFRTVSKNSSKEFESRLEYGFQNFFLEYKKSLKIYVDYTTYETNIKKIQFSLFKKCIVPFVEDILKLKSDAVFEFCENKWRSFPRKWSFSTKVPWKYVQKYRRLVQNIIDNHENNDTSSTFNSLTEFFKSKLDEEFEKFIVEFRKFPDINVWDNYVNAINCTSYFENIPEGKFHGINFPHKPIKDLSAYLRSRVNDNIHKTFNYVDSMLSKFFQDIYNIKDHEGIKDDRKCYDYKEKYEDACIDMFRELFLKKKTLTFVFEKSSYDKKFLDEELNVASVDYVSGGKRIPHCMIRVKYYLWPTSIRFN